MINFILMIFILAVPVCRDNKEISKTDLLEKSLFELKYPLSVERFYRNIRFDRAWISIGAAESRTWTAMMLLDCVLQYGLSHADYHPDQLVHSKLRRIFADEKNISSHESTAFDIYLTDAIITLINDLHFGKANPQWPRSRIDREVNAEFDAVTILQKALASRQFLETILDVQPRTENYRALQRYMVQIRGQYLDDCYTVPEAEARKIAINMEREKWCESTPVPYIEVNLPSYILSYHTRDTIYSFKVVIGSKDKQTPELRSAITYLNTAPDWKIPQNIFTTEILPNALKNRTYLEVNHYTIYDPQGLAVVPTRAALYDISRNPVGFSARQSASREISLGRIAFHFPNDFGLYLFDGQKSSVFNEKERTWTNGCVAVQNAPQLAELLLSGDGQKMMVKELVASADAYVPKNFILKNVIPFVITYRTCEIKSRIPSFYDDPYGRDIQFEKAFYSDRLNNVNE